MTATSSGVRTGSPSAPAPGAGGEMGNDEAAAGPAARSGNDGSDTTDNLPGRVGGGQFLVSSGGQITVSPNRSARLGYLVNFVLGAGGVAAGGGAT